MVHLQFTWGSVTGSDPWNDNVITVTTTNTDQTQQTQTFTFNVWKSSSQGYSASPPTMTSAWNKVLNPDLSSPGQATIGGEYYQVGMNTGELLAGHVLPAYNPGVAPLGLHYSSLAAEPKPIFVVHYQIDPSQAVPTTVSAQLTLNGSAGSTFC